MKLVFAMEEGQLNAEGTGELVPAQAAEMESGVAEAVQANGEVEELVTAIEESVADADQLTDIQEVMVDSVQSGQGVNEETAEIAKIATEAVFARLGIEAAGVIPAMENFGGAQTRVHATNVAIENLGENIQRIWEAIKKAIATTWQKIKDLWTNLFTSAGSIEKTANELVKQVGSLDSKLTAKEAKFKSSGLAQAFNDGSKTDGSTALAVIARHEELTKKFGSGVAAFTSIGEAAKKYAGNIKTEDANEVKTAAGNLVRGLKAAGAVDYTPEDDKAAVGSRIEGMVNNSTFELVARSGDDGRIESNVGTSVKEFKGEEVAVLSRDEMKNLAAAAAALGKSTADLKKTTGQIESVQKALFAAADAAIKAAKTGTKASGAEGSEDNTGAAKALDKLKRIVTDTSNAGARYIQFIPTNNLRAGKAAVNYVQASLKQYKDNTEKK